MECMSAASLSFPYIRRASVKCAILRNQNFSFNRASFSDQSSYFNRAKFQPPQAQKSPTDIQEEHGLSSSSSKSSPAVISGEQSLPSLSQNGKIISQDKLKQPWLDKVPASLRSYIMLARVNRDIGVWLQVWPSYWSIVLATKPRVLPDPKLMVLLGAVCFLMHTSCCTLNDLRDMEYDKKVERCRVRPLASGALTLSQGWSFWGIQVLLMTPLLLPLNKISIGLAAAQSFLWFVYPLLKRVTYLPQAFLGVASNWGALVAWAAVRGNFADIGTILPIYIGSVFWTLVFDTIYAHQDKRDDVKAGVKSTALLFGDSTLYWNLGFSAISIGCFLLGGYNGGLGWPYYASMIAATAHLLWQVLTVDLSNPIDCAKKFLSNKWFGAIVFAGMLLGRLAP